MRTSILMEPHFQGCAMPKLYAVLAGAPASGKRPAALPHALRRALAPHAAELAGVRACGGGSFTELGENEGNAQPVPWPRNHCFLQGFKGFSANRKISHAAAALRLVAARCSSPA